MKTLNAKVQHAVDDVRGRVRRVPVRPPSHLIRRRRTRLVAASAAVVLALGAASVVTAFVLRQPSNDVAAPSAHPVLLGIGHVWPDAPMEGTPVEVAQAFASEALGWTDAIAGEDPPGDPTGPVWVRLEHPTAVEYVKVLTVPSLDGGRSIFQIGTESIAGGPNVGAREPGSPGTIITIVAAPGAVRANVSVRTVTTDQISIDVDFADSTRAPEPPATTLVEGNAQSALPTGGSLAVDIGVDDPLEVASVLVRYFDRDGATISAVGGHYTPQLEFATGQIDGPVFASPSPPPGEQVGMAARVMGTITFDDRGCLMLELEGIEYPIVWPAGTSWQPDLPAVLLPDGQIVAPGMSVLGDGGYMKSVTHMAGPDVNDAATACIGSTGEIAIFNLGAEVTVTSR